MFNKLLLVSVFAILASLCAFAPTSAPQQDAAGARSVNSYRNFFYHNSSAPCCTFRFVLIPMGREKRVLVKDITVGGRSNLPTLSTTGPKDYRIYIGGVERMYYIQQTADSLRIKFPGGLLVGANESLEIEVAGLTLGRQLIGMATGFE